MMRTGMRAVMVMVACGAMLTACGGSSSDADAGQTTPGTDGSDGTDGTDGTDGGECAAVAAAAGDSYEEGQKMVDYQLNNCAKEAVSASSLLCKSKCLLTYFGAGWCTPCREKQPTLQKYYEKYNKDGLEIAVILREDAGPDDPATSTFCQEWTDEYSLTFPVLTDPIDKVTGKFLGGGGATFPVIVLTNNEWQIGLKGDGGTTGLEDVIQACLGL